MATLACIGQPISWLRLEMFALDGGDAGVREHVDGCAACRQCLDEIQRDVVALPPLALSPKGTSFGAPAPKRHRWWRIALPAFGALAAAAILLLVLRPREPSRDNVAYIKGVGEVIIDVVRERAGVIRTDARSFAVGDRFKVIVTCAPSHEVSLVVAVREDGAQHVDHPLAPARITCGNRVVIPGAFTLTGNKPHRVCARIDDAADACLVLSPE
jgi:hypothetical protein